ncbi:MAG: hypothetical protein KDJ75_09950 [Alphaproteobacteria bacterium]|nr:hypothetical protein [Alphaproteobacteria bacterium]
MAIQNPDYNPEWEALYNYHHEQRIRLRDEKETKDFTDPEFDRLSREQNFHHSICLHCLNSLQHKTTQDYARWLFSLSLKPIDKNLIPPFESFETFDQVDRAYDYAKSLIKKREKLQRCQAKPGRPDGLDIFEKTANNRLHTNWKHYMLENFIGEPLPDMVTLVTVDDRKTVKHVCFFTDDHEDRKFVLPYLKYLAGAFITEDTGMRYVDYCTARKKSRMFKLWPKLRRSRLLPDYHFYVHSMPHSLHDETLYKFRMDHDWDANYRPERAHPTSVIMSKHYEKTVPQALIQAVDDHIGFDDLCLERC